MSASVFDYVIVGAGSAGCVLGNRLAADGRNSVLLLEAGPRDRYPWIHIPIGYAKTMFQWAALGNPGWSYRDVLPYFRKLEHNVRGADEFHGDDGPLWASDIEARIR